MVPTVPRDSQVSPHTQRSLVDKAIRPPMMAAQERLHASAHTVPAPWDASCPPDEYLLSSSYVPGRGNPRRIWFLPSQSPGMPRNSCSTLPTLLQCPLLSVKTSLTPPRPPGVSCFFPGAISYEFSCLPCTGNNGQLDTHWVPDPGAGHLSSHIRPQALSASAREEIVPPFTDEKMGSERLSLA